ncbi:MAG: glycerophosphodiester phosphodiesterase family protein, partial [Thermodesulfobacteriota bacterium]
MLSAIDEPGLIVGHRGAASLAPENTLSSARKALSTGADMWELDVALSADDVPFLIHDDHLRRTSDAPQVFPDRSPWRPDQFTWEELRRLDFGSWYATKDPFGQIAQGAVSPEEAAAFRGLKAPSLAEALAFTRERNWRVNVEIKDLSDAPGPGRVVRLVVERILD